MITSKLSYNPIGKTMLAIEHSQQESNLVILGLEVEQKKGELDISQHFITNSIQGVSGFVKNIQQANLIVTDDNILAKEVYSTGADNEILSEAYPNLNQEDFYYEILKTTTKSFIAICRKQYIDTLIGQYLKENIRITNVSLGNLKINALSSYVGDTKLLSYSSSIEIINEEVFAIQPKKDDTKENYQIDTISIPSTHTLPLAFILDSFSDQEKITGNIEEKNIHLHNQYKESLFFKKTLQYGIGLLLVLLLLNFFVFNSKYKKWQGLQEEMQVYTTQSESIKKRQSSVDTKEAVVNSILTTGFSKSSYYIDQVIQIQPSTVILNSFTYQPIAKTIRNDKAIQLKDNQISITGNSSDKRDFTTWLNTIENLSFVKEVTIINYGIDKKNTSSFEVTILLAHDTAK